MSKPNGVILYQGPSLLDGAPIVAIAVGLSSASTNRKTGAMLQTYILRSRIEPTAAVADGRDASICGDCKHRGTNKGKARTCYVQVGQGPLSVYRAYRRGKYPRIPESEISALGQWRTVRLGAYGDPAAVPTYIWDWLIAHAKGHTGYTHQWKQSTALRHICMASVDSPEEALEAQRLGWRTFRVGMQARNEVSKAMLKESLCPASEAAGKLLKCSQCLACGGADGRKGSIFIPAHGGVAIMASVRRLAGIPIRVEA
jgi:hypothetical protein